MIRKICQFVVLLVVSPLVLFSLGFVWRGPRRPSFWDGTTMYEFTVRPTPQGYVAVTITPTMDGRKRPGRVYAFSCNEARTLFRELYLALCAAPPE